MSHVKMSYAKLLQKSQQLKTYTVRTGTYDMIGFGIRLAAWFEDHYVAPCNIYATAYNAWLDESERTPVKTQDIQTTSEILLNAYRQVTNLMHADPLVTADDLIHMGLPPRPSGGRTPAPTPISWPLATTDTSTLRQVTLNFVDSVTGKKGKPKGVHGAETRWAILNDAPASIDELINSSFDTNSPLTLTFTEEQRGKRIWFALRWENTTGAKGPFSAIESAIVP
jgi:hypothetical protein